MPDFTELQMVNIEVNKIPYVMLPKLGEGSDVWKDTPDGGTWECRDYVLAKVKRLLDLNWDKNDLTVVLCWTEPVTVTSPGGLNRGYHAVLGAKLSGLIYILDSRFDDVYLWNQPPADYLWDRQLIPGTTDFRDARQGLV